MTPWGSVYANRINLDLKEGAAPEHHKPFMVANLRYNKLCFLINIIFEIHSKKANYTVW